MWSSAASLPPNFQPLSATLLASGKVLVAGAFYGATDNSAQIYDSVQNTWSPAGSWSSPAVTSTTLLPGGNVLVVGGIVGVASVDRQMTSSAAEVYGPSTNVWSPLPNMLQLRSVPSVVVLPNGNVFVTGGRYPDAGNRAELYNPVANSWSPTGAMAVPCDIDTRAILLSSGRVLVVGGAQQPFHFVLLALRPGHKYVGGARQLVP